jgi:hypothetical protein
MAKTSGFRPTSSTTTALKSSAKKTKQQPPIQKNKIFVKTFAELCSIEIGPTCCQGKLGEND